MASQEESGPRTQDPLPSPRDSERSAQWQSWVRVGFLLLLIVGLAVPTVYNWLAILSQRPFTENIPQVLTVLFLLWAFWQVRLKLKAQPRFHVQLDWVGLLALSASGLVYTISVCLSIKMVMFTSLIALMASLCRIGLGKTSFARCVPGFLFALFLLPQFPTDIRTAISLPLQLISTQWATGLASLFIPIQTLGNIFYIRGEAFEVTVACSGLNTWVGYLFAGMLGLLMGHFSWGRLLRLVLAAPLLALMENAIRLWITALVAYWVSADAGIAIHTNLEYLLFPLGLWAMVQAEQAIQRRWGAKLTPQSASIKMNVALPTVPAALNNGKLNPWAWLTIGLLVLINMGVWLPQLNLPASTTRSVTLGGALATVPLRLGDWQGHDLPLLHDEAAILAPAQLISREYQLKPAHPANPNAKPPILWLNLLEATSMNTLHNLVDSLIASGAKPRLMGVLSIATRKGPLKASWYHCVDEEGKPYHLLLWYEWPGGNADNRWLWYWNVLRLKLQKQETTWRLVEIATPGSESDASPAQAQKLDQLKQFAAALYSQATP